MLKREFRLMIVAVQFLTRLPLPSLHNFQAQDLQLSARYFPLVGLLVGGLTAGVFVFFSHFFNPWIAALGSTAFSLLLTGAFHEDGWADTCDGLGGGLTREQALAIMKDSRLGTYGTLGLICVLALKVALLASLPLAAAVFALCCAHGLSRWCSVLLLRFLSYAGHLEDAKTKPLAQHLSSAQAVIASLPLLSLLPLLYWLPITSSWLVFFLPLTAMLLVTLLLARLFLRRLGGYTGDNLGATQQMTELTCYLMLAALWQS